MRAADLAVCERASRFHRDLPEQHFAQLVEQLLDIVGFAHRYAAGRDHDVGGFGRARKCALELLRGILDHAHVDDFAAEARQHAVQRVAVAVVDLAGPERRADRSQLVAGGEERDPQSPVNADLA